MLSNKGTILGVRNLRKTFYKFIKYGTSTDCQYNAPIVSKRRLIVQNSGIKTDLKNHLRIATLDVNTDIRKIYNFVSSNFLELETYKVKVTQDLLKWFLSDCVITVIEDNDNDIMSLSAYKVENIMIENEMNKYASLKVVCTDKSYRNKGYATKLLAHIQKDLINQDILSGLFMSNMSFMKEFSKLKYFYRPINAEILLTAGFSGFKEADFRNSNMNIVDYFKIDPVYTATVKKFDYADIEKLYELYNNNNAKYNFFVSYTLEEFKNLLCNDSIDTYCFYKKDEIVDFVSYYALYHESIVNKKRKDIKVANLFMYTTNDLTVYKIVKNLLIILAENTYDMVSMLDNLENELITEPLRFMDSQSYNFLYLFNWNINDYKNYQIGSIVYI